MQLNESVLANMNHISNSIANQRINQLRVKMREEGIDAYIVLTNDPHASEYVPDYWKGREWLSGFTGSAGTLVVTSEEAGLWTDSRYFIQAEQQLKGSGIKLLKERIPGTPDIAQWISSKLTGQQVIGINGWTTSIDEVHKLENTGITIQDVGDLLQGIWADRPEFPSQSVEILPLTISGCSAENKLTTLRQAISNKGCKGILISSLDEIAWLLNLRGQDIHCNPVFTAYLLLTEQQAALYVHPSKITQELNDYLQPLGIELRLYGQIEFDLTTLPGNQMILVPPTTNFRLYSLLKHHIPSCIHLESSPIALMKAIKNPIEIEGFHQAMLRDGVAMVRFIHWLEQNIGKPPLTECDICDQLERFRAENDYFRGISFDTIAGYGANGAIVHYKPERGSDQLLKPEGLLLLDSGAQYQDGTTDITRTLPLGPLTERECLDYTLVLKGMIALSVARFPEGTSGTQLDVLARQFMWAEGINYGHGTGHGVGHFLNVHEGPQQIRMNYVPTPLQEGMTITNEPGIYRNGNHGVRIENTMLVVSDQTTEFGHYLRFEPLTLCPISTRPICKALMTESEIKWLNSYHELVRSRLLPYLSGEDAEWLIANTAPIS